MVNKKIHIQYLLIVAVSLDSIFDMYVSWGKPPKKSKHIRFSDILQNL